MGSFNTTGIRDTLSGGIAAVASAVAIAPEATAAVRPKTPGSTKVVALFGTTDRYNGIGHEIHVRSIFQSKQDWQFVFVRAGKLFTPELIADADLLIVDRDGGPDPIDLFTENAGVSDTITPGTGLWTDETVSAIIDNVQNRGMGLLAMRGTVLCGSQRLMTFLDVAGMEPHNLEPIWYTRINTDHPVMQGVGKFSILIDEQPLAIIKSATTATLFESTAVHEKRQGVSGWALEREAGRIVGLLPGATIHAYQTPEYRNIVWRAAHWAMRRDIPPCPDAENRYY